MKYVYDSDADSLYVTVRPGTVDHTVELADGVVLDVDADGQVLGVDVMVPSHGWNASLVAERAHLTADQATLLDRLAAATWPTMVP